MNQMIRKMEEKDREEIMEMMRVFYASPAVLSNGSDEIFLNDIENYQKNRYNYEKNTIYYSIII